MYIAELLQIQYFAGKMQLSRNIRIAAENHVLASSL